MSRHPDPPEADDDTYHDLELDPRTVEDMILHCATAFAEEVQELTDRPVVLEHSEDMRTILLTVPPEDEEEEPEPPPHGPIAPRGKVNINVPPVAILNEVKGREDN